MGQEISQYDIPDRQLLAIRAQPGVWTDIGEAKIIHTMFGRAKVRVIREQDKNIRAGLLTALAVTAIAAAVWQGWITYQQTELLHSAAPPLPLSARIRVSEPVFQPEYLPHLATQPSVASKPSTPSQIGINNPATSRSSAPQQPIGLKAVGQMVAKPETAQTLIASRSQTKSPATNNDSSMNQTDRPPIPKLSAPLQPEAPIVATPTATKAAAQPAASRPVAPLVVPMVKSNTSAPSPAGTTQPSEPVSMQP